MEDLRDRESPDLPSPADPDVREIFTPRRFSDFRVMEFPYLRFAHAALEIFTLTFRAPMLPGTVELPSDLSRFFLDLQSLKSPGRVIRYSAARAPFAQAGRGLKEKYSAEWEK